MKVKLTSLSTVLAAVLISAVSFNTAAAAGKTGLKQFTQKKAQSTIKRINQQLPEHAKLKKHQKQRIRGIVERHQSRLAPLKRDLQLTKQKLRHQNIHKRKNAQQIKQLRQKQYNLEKRMQKVRQNQQQKIASVLSKQQHHFLKGKQQVRNGWEHHHRR